MNIGAPLSAWLLMRSIRRLKKLEAATDLSKLKSGLFPHSLFVLRAIDDEAALVLAAGVIANRLTAFVGQVWTIASVILILALALAGLLRWLGGRNDLDR